MSVTVSAWKLNKAVFAPGDTATVTITYTATENSDTQVPINVPAGGGFAPGVTAFFTLSIRLPNPISLTDPSGRKWTLVSDNGTVAVFSTPT